MNTLDGRIALITGAAKGIGRQYALYFAAEGARVIVNNRRPTGSPYLPKNSERTSAADVVAEIRAQGGSAVADFEDVTDWAGGRRVVARAIEAFGDLHVVVNNAAYLWDGDLVDMTEEQWDGVVDVHLKGSFVPLRSAAEYWRDQRRAGRRVTASVVNTTSGAGLFGNTGYINYCAAKGGVQAMTIAAAQELEPLGIRVNCVSPGGRTRWMLAQPGETNGARMRDLIQPPAGPGAFDEWDPANLAPFVAWLATEDCPVTGQILRIRGGDMVVMHGWHPGQRLHLDRRWTVEELRQATVGMAWAQTPIWEPWLTANLAGSMSPVVDDADASATAAPPVG
jgi:NAD(P)-dependent dehydrogenase (short-subunit alcohol dehydrogenase family)